MLTPIRVDTARATSAAPPYGDIDYTVTAPAGYTIAGSGVLQNATEVLTPTQRERLARASRSDSTVAIITDDEARATPITNNH